MDVLLAALSIITIIAPCIAGFAWGLCGLIDA